MTDLSEQQRSQGDAVALPPVMIVCLAIRHGGVDVRIVQTAQELRRRGQDFVVAVIAGTGLHRTLESLRLPCLPLRRSRTDPRIVLDLVRAIRSMGIGVIDAHNTQSQHWSAIAAALTGVKGRIATIHSVYREDHPGRLRQSLHESAIHLCKRLGFAFIAVSSNVAAYLGTTMGIPAERILLSRNGMEDLPEAPPTFDLAAETEWPSDSMVLAIIGRLDPRKGHRFVLSALAEIVQSGETRARLLIVGTGREEQAIRDLVQALGLMEHVRFLGFRSDVTSILTRVDLLCLPSTSEGLPYALLEAARQAVPTLASRLEGTDDVFVEGETILFCSVGDSECIRGQITLLLNNPEKRRAIGLAARQKLLSDLSVDRMLDETFRLYQSRA